MLRVAGIPAIVLSDQYVVFYQSSQGEITPPPFLPALMTALVIRCCDARYNGYNMYDLMVSHALNALRWLIIGFLKIVPKIILQSYSLKKFIPVCFFSPEPKKSTHTHTQKKTYCSRIGSFIT